VGRHVGRRFWMGHLEWALGEGDPQNGGREWLAGFVGYHCVGKPLAVRVTSRGLDLFLHWQGSIGTVQLADKALGRLVGASRRADSRLSSRAVEHRVAG